MARKEREPTPYDNVPLQLHHLSPEEIEAVDARMAQTGKASFLIRGAKAAATASLATANERKNDPSLSADQRAAAARTAAKHQAHLENIDIIRPRKIKDESGNVVGTSGIGDVEVSRTAAATRRTSLTLASGRRVREEFPEATNQLELTGAGWYFFHRGKLNDIAAQTGFDEDKIVTASAVMSPRNSPDSERLAVHGLAQLERLNPTLELHPTLAKKLKLNTTTVKYGDLTPEQAARISAGEDDRHLISGVDHSLLALGAHGGSHENKAKAISVLRGITHVDDAINPHTAPKVWSYRDSTWLADPRTPEYHEYMARAHHVLFEHPNQLRLDLDGLQDATHGILSPTKTTAEDTWQSAITTGQPLAPMYVAGQGRGVSAAKFIASEKVFTDLVNSKSVTYRKGRNKKTTVIGKGDPRITGENIRHAWNNAATIESAQQLSDMYGEIVPSVLPQETGWTEARRRAEADPEYIAMLQAQSSRSSHFEAGHKQGETQYLSPRPGQLPLF